MELFSLSTCTELKMLSIWAMPYSTVPLRWFASRGICSQRNQIMWSKISPTRTISFLLLYIISYHCSKESYWLSNSDLSRNPWAFLTSVIVLFLPVQYKKTFQKIQASTSRTEFLKAFKAVFIRTPTLSTMTE